MRPFFVVPPFFVDFLSIFSKFSVFFRILRIFPGFWNKIKWGPNLWSIFRICPTKSGNLVAAFFRQRRLGAIYWWIDLILQKFMLTHVILTKESWAQLKADQGGERMCNLSERRVPKSWQQVCQKARIT